MKKTKQQRSNGSVSNGARRGASELTRLQHQVQDLKDKLKKQKRACKALKEECDEYRSVILQQFKRTCNLEEWENVKEEDFRYTMNEILAEWERDQRK